MTEPCAECHKNRDSIAMLNRTWFVDDTDGGTLKQDRICIWCAEAAAAKRELYPDSDNLIGCPKCGNDMLRNRAVCFGCREEIRAYYS